MVESNDKFPDIGIAKPAAPGRVRVTIEFLPELPGRPAAPIVMEYDHASFVQEQGINYIPGSTPATWGQLDGIQPNGQHRASIKLWSGCESFESFRAKTTGPAISSEGHAPGPKVCTRGVGHHQECPSSTGPRGLG